MVKPVERFGRSQAAKEEAEREAAEMKAQPNVAPVVKKKSDLAV